MRKYTHEIQHLRDWLARHCPATPQGFYLDGDNGQPNPADVYCREHAREMARRLTHRTGATYRHAEAWAGGDTVEYCAITTCAVPLFCGGLTKEGVRWALGLDEEKPLAFVAEVVWLEMAANAMMPDDPLWDVWISQVLRLQRRPTKAQQLAFEAAWIIGERETAFDILRRRTPRRSRA